MIELGFCSDGQPKLERLLMLRITIAAVHGPVAGGLKRHFAFFSTIGARGFEHFFWAAVERSAITVTETASVTVSLHNVFLV